MAQEKITPGMYRKFFELIEQKKVTGGLFAQILSSGILADLFDQNANLANREHVRAALGLTRLDTYMSESFDLTVDGNGLNACLFSFGHHVTPFEVQNEIERAGWHPGSVEHVDAYATQFPEGVYPGVVVGLMPYHKNGSNLLRAYSGKKSVRRRHDMDSGNGTFDTGYRFLAVLPK